MVEQSEQYCGREPDGGKTTKYRIRKKWLGFVGMPEYCCWIVSNLHVSGCSWWSLLHIAYDVWQSTIRWRFILKTDGAVRDSNSSEVEQASIVMSFKNIKTVDAVRALSNVLDLDTAHNVLIILWPWINTSKFLELKDTHIIPSYMDCSRLLCCAGSW